MVFHFEHVQLGNGKGGKWDIVPFGLLDLKAVLGRWQAGLAEVGWNSLYWSNHDQPRAVSRFGDDGEYRVQSAKLLGTVLHLHRGTPYIYQGEELGMTNVPFSSIEDFRDIESLNYYSEAVASGKDPADVLTALRLRSRDNGRAPMQWNDSAHAGFTLGEPTMPVNPNYTVINADAERADSDSVLHHYRKLIALRHDLPVVAYGDFTMLLPQDPQIYAFTRRLEDVELLVIANFSKEIVNAALPDADDWAASELLLTNYSQAGSEEPLRLRPWEARVFRRTVSG
jgi:oligo-1,6-glucosidase